MTNLIRTASLAALLSLAPLAVRAAEPGYADLGKFAPTEGCQFVEVNLGGPLLKLAAAFVDKDEPQAAALIRSLKHVRVNVVGFNEDSHAGTTERMGEVRRSLESDGWAQIVTVREKEKSDDVVVYVKMNASEAIEGLVVTVLDRGSRQAVLVNVVGNLKPEQLSALGKGLHIDGLSGIDWSKPVTLKRT